MKKILYGVCGIGAGHANRQLPLIEHFSKACRIVIFAYGYSYDFYLDKFKGNETVSVIRVAVPFYICNEKGVDFETSAQLPQNRYVDFKSINNLAKGEAHKILGVPDLVISDYEPISAEYAYERNVSLVTIDQQSKYLCADFPQDLNGFSYQDEVFRLHYFFPRADARIACSFFQVPMRSGCDDIVKISSPIIKDEIISMDYRPSSSNNILVYVSGARKFAQMPEEILRICSKQGNAKFHVFLSSGEVFNPNRFAESGTRIYQHGDSQFNQMLRECNGIVSTAGHSLLSEAMYLGIPVYAIPVEPYEQQMNAHIIDKYTFGVAHHKLDAQKLEYFINNLQRFRDSISEDKNVLLRGAGQKEIISFIEAKYL